MLKNLSLHEINKDLINALINSINAVAKNYFEIHNSLFSSYRHSLVFTEYDTFITNMNNLINYYDKSLKPQLYLKLLKTLYEFISILKKDTRERYFYEGLKELLIENLKMITETNWNEHRDIKQGLENLSSEIEKKSMDAKTEKKGKIQKEKSVWKYLCESLPGRLKENTAHALVCEVEAKLGLPGKPQQINIENSGSAVSQKGQIGLIINESKKLKLKNEAEKKEFLQLRKEVKKNPNKQDLKRLIDIINKNDSSMMHTYFVFCRQLEKWDSKNIVDMCLDFLRDYAANRRHEDTPFEDIKERTEDFLYAFIEQILEPLNSIFSRSIVSNFDDANTFEMGRFKEGVGKMMNPKKTEPDAQTENQDQTELQTEPETEPEISGDEMKAMKRKARKLFLMVSDVNSDEQEKIMHNTAVLQALSGTYDYLNQYRHLREGSRAKERARLFIRNVIRLKECSPQLVKIEALKYVEGEGSYSPASSLTETSRFRFLVGSGIINDNNKLLNKSFSSHILFFKNLPVPKSRRVADEDISLSDLLLYS